jgi:predicted XRE-type DNA-binding protein
MNDHQASSPRFSSIWEALEDTSQEAATMRLRAELLRNLQKNLRASGLANEQASARMRITKARMNDLLSGNISAFSVIDLAHLNSIIS